MPRAWIAPLTVAVLLLAACGWQPRAKRDYGPCLTDRAAEGLHGPAFSADGGEVFFVHEGPGEGDAWQARLEAVGTTGGAVRAVDAERVSSDLTPTPDGGALYYVASDVPAPGKADTYHLREAISRADVPVAPLTGFHAAPVASPAGDALLLADGQSATVLALADRTLTAVPCWGAGPAVFSPAGDEIACVPAGGAWGALARVRVAGGRRTELRLPSRSAHVQLLSWSAGRLLGAFEDGAALLVSDLESGAVLATVPASDGVRLVAQSFTHDGRALAYARARDLGQDCTPLHGCRSFSEQRVMVLDLGTGQAREIASGEGLVGMAFSPDRATVAYQYGSEVCVRRSGL